MSKIKFGIPNKNAKVITVDGVDYTIPKITLYHRQFIQDTRKDATVYEIIVPLIKKIVGISADEKINTDLFEYLVIKLLEHNDLLKSVAIIDNEKFNLEYIEMCGQSTFLVDGIEYKFKRPSYEVIYNTFLSGLNDLQIDSEHDFSEMGIPFIKVAHDVFSTIRIIGSEGSELRGLNLILDNFVDPDRIALLGGKYGQL